MQIPDLKSIAQSLNSAEPIEAWLSPYRAFVFVGLLQLALRHPQLSKDTPEVAEVARSMAQNLIAKLEAIDPAIAIALEQGWDSALDMDSAEFEQAQLTGQQKRRVETHNAYTLYELNPDGSEAEQLMIMLSRPQSWGDRSRWHYYRCKTEHQMADTIYINHCHVWQEVERKPAQAFAACGEALFWAIQPGTPEELCSDQYLAEEDFWHETWGEMPPVWRSPVSAEHLSPEEDSDDED